MTEEFKSEIKKIFPNALFDEEMKKHTTFKIGGCADVLADCDSEENIISGIKLCKKHNVPYMVMGNGSNLLVSDKGIGGVVFKIGGLMKEIRTEGNKIYAMCGARLSSVAAEAMRNSLSGLEFASGIPGTLGGGIYMNAGAYGGEMKDVVKSVRYIDENGEIKTALITELDFSYRHSFFSDKKCVIISAEMELTAGVQEEINQKMIELNQRRKEKQPLEYPSAGSTFKRPEGYFAGKLIQDSGLSGFGIGGASVSEKHAGFVINSGNATAEDVEKLIEYIRKTVYDKFGVMLEPEIKITGR